MSEVEVNKCSICGKVTPVARQYYYYDISCECCGGDQHFEIVWYCCDCEPKEPTVIKPHISVKNLPKFKKENKMNKLQKRFEEETGKQYIKHRVLRAVLEETEDGHVIRDEILEKICDTLEWLEAQLTWRSVEDKPTDNEYKLVKIEGCEQIEFCEIASYSDGSWYDGEYTLENVAKWLPIPKLDK